MNRELIQSYKWNSEPEKKKRINCYNSHSYQNNSVGQLLDYIVSN